MKFIGFKQDPFRPINLNDTKKWRKSKDGSYKLLKPDLVNDRQFFTAEVSTKALDKPDEKLWIHGVANANIIDRMQERLDPKGIDVIDYVKNRQLLAHHSYYHPIGQVEELDINENGVHFSAWIGDPSRAELTDMQKEIRSLVAQGILKTVSVGFIPKKIKAPMFGEDGTMTEPAVIESWELLELSVVAVPCNQDSVFEMRSAQKTGSINENQKHIDETTTSEASAVKKVANTKAEDTPPQADDTQPKEMSEEILTTVRGMYEIVKRQSEVIDLILAKLESDSGGESAEAQEPEPEVEAGKAQEQTPSENEKRLEEIEKTLVGFKTQFDKLTDVVKLLSNRLK